jgi:hypothetical protein
LNGVIEALAPTFSRACDNLQDQARIIKGARADEEDGIFTSGKPTQQEGTQDIPEVEKKQAMVAVSNQIDSITCYCRLFRNLSAGCTANQSALCAHGVLATV